MEGEAMITQEDMPEYGNEALLSDYVSVSETLGRIYDDASGDPSSEEEEQIDRLEAEATTMKAEIHRRMKRGEHGLTGDEAVVLEQLVEAVREITFYETAEGPVRRLSAVKDLVFEYLPVGVAAPAIANTLQARKFNLNYLHGIDEDVVLTETAVEIITDIARKA